MNPTHHSQATSPTLRIQVGDEHFAYRVMGAEAEVPVVLLNHLAGNLDNWDPRVVDGLAASHRVVTFNNRGVGGSTGDTPATVDEMAEDAIAFVEALGFPHVDALGFSLGGAVLQTAALKRPELFRRMILAGIGPKGGVGIDRIPGMAYRNQLKALLTFTDVLEHLFFTRTRDGRRAAKAFVARIKERTEDRDQAVSLRTFRRQLAAISDYASQPMPDFSRLGHPVLVANGESDIMVPSVNSAHLALAIPNAELVLYRDAGHGGIFQYHAQFVPRALSFLGDGKVHST